MSCVAFVPCEMVNSERIYLASIYIIYTGLYVLVFGFDLIVHVSNSRRFITVSYKNSISPGLLINVNLVCRMCIRNT